MTYVHPWTLRAGEGDDHVPFVGSRRQGAETWQEALQTWLDGGILCNEAARYVGNFLSTYRVRPGDDDSDGGNSDDLISDDELQVSKASLEEALTSRIGGREVRDEEEQEEVEGGSSHYHNSLAAMNLGNDIWNGGEGATNAAAPQFQTPSSLQEMLAAAAA